MNSVLTSATGSVPPGGWAIGVSGGADSVALLTLMRSRADIGLHIVHLNHQTRGSESDRDEEFVGELATQLKLPVTIGHRSEMEGERSDLPANASARYRQLRFELFRQVVREKQLRGVLLGHHADDQAETILHRLVRGSSFSGLAGMSVSTVIGGLCCHRPLLRIRRQVLRRWLAKEGQTWREDSSNASRKYLRNRLRRVLADDATLTDALLELGDACRALRDWQRAAVPMTRDGEGDVLNVDEITRLPHILGAAVARRWLADRGVARFRIEPRMIETLLQMCADAATPARSQVSTGMIAARRKGGIEMLIST